METWNLVLQFILRPSTSGTIQRNGELKAERGEAGRDQLTKWMEKECEVRNVGMFTLLDDDEGGAANANRFVQKSRLLCNLEKKH
jgi:hypothetical protein